MTDDAVDVLIVDDTKDAAETYAQLVRSSTGLNIGFTDDPKRALDIVRANSVKVLVLDQRMPISGTELYAQLHRVDPAVRAIMLTGLATEEEIGEALNLGFKSYLPKSRVSDLAQRVLREYAAYLHDIVAAKLETQRPVVLVRKGRSRWGRSVERVEYRLLRVEPLIDQYVLDPQWNVLATLQVGQKEKVSLKRTVEHTLVLERESTDQLSFQMGFSAKNLAELQASLAREITTRFSQVETVRSTDEQQIERTLELPAEPGNPDQLHVVSRRIEAAQVYRLIRIDLLVNCSCCSLRNTVGLEVRVSTGRAALKQIDRLSDNTLREHDLGF